MTTAPERPRRWSRWGLLAVLVAVVVAVVVGRRPPRPTRPLSAAARPDASSTAPARPVRSVVSAIDLAPIAALERDPDQLAVYREAYVAANRYPPTTISLVPGMVDLLEPDHYPATERPMPGVRNAYTREADRVYYRLESSRVRLVDTEPVELRLTVFRGNVSRTPVAATVAPVEVRRLDLDGRVVRLGTLALSEQSVGVYVGRYTPPRRRSATEDDVLRFELAWRLAASAAPPAQAFVQVQHTPFPSARFTGRVGDRLVGGSLVVDVEVDSERSGRAQLAANVLGGDGAPVAAAVATVELTKGRQRVPLVVYGLAIRDRGVAGPYRIEAVRGHFPSTISAGRGSEFARAAGAHTTAAYRLDDFTTAPWDSETKRAVLASYDRELEAVHAAVR